MNKWTIFAIAASSTVGAIVLGLVILAIVSRKVYHRSLMATLIVFYFRLTVRHKSDDKVRADVKRLPSKNDIPYVVPRRVRTRAQQSYDFGGMTVVNVNMGEENSRVIMYLHGGGYVRQPRIYHWKYLNKLGKRLGNLVVPIYPKAPCHHPLEAIELLTKLYLELADRYDKVVLMGDSSGGGFALSLCQHWGELGLKQPDKTILFSPWADLTLTNPEIDKYEKLDPLIPLNAERIWARLWAHDLQLTDWRVSPMFGPMSKLGEVVLYVGDREILYPDLCKLYGVMKEQGVSVRFAVGRGMNHVYQVYPIPEARKAFAEVVNEIEQL